MAANRILDEFGRFMTFVNDGFKYNLQVFPDTITAASLLFTLLFQSPAFGAFTGSIALLNFVHPKLAKFLTNVFGGLEVADSQRCSGHFPGSSFERQLFRQSTSSFGELDDATMPTYYSTFIGFLIAYLGAMPIIYQREISASPRRKAATTLGFVVLGFVILMTTYYRIMSSCDSLMGTFVGILAGVFVGVMCVGLLAYATRRRLTNLLSYPLIENKLANGKPIYVCER